MNDFKRAVRLIQSGATAQACQHLAQWLAVHANDAGAFELYGLTLAGLGRRDDAVEALRRTLALDAKRTRAHYNLGTLLLQTGRLSESAEELRAAAELDPNRVDHFVNLGHVTRLLGALSEAEMACRSAVRLDPQSASAWLNLGNVLKDQSRIVEATEAYDRASSLDPKGLIARSNALLGRCYVERDPQKLGESHRSYGEALAKTIRQRPWKPRKPHTRLRIGYVSADFRWHSVTRFFGTVLSRHDRNMFDIHLYSDVEAPDLVTRMMAEAATTWVDAFRLTDEELWARIRSDEVDVLVDLAGHTGRRLGVFARRAAPIQITWLGYPFSTGLEAMDYRITDAVADPPGAEAWHSESLLRLPGPFLCYQAPGDAPEVGPAPILDSGNITFGSFNHLSKLSEDTLTLFASVLCACPKARLLLKCTSLSDSSTRQRTVERFAQHGVPADRLELLGRLPQPVDHLRCYGRVDIGLDPIPYNGTTTTMEAIWMGVPVLTLAGSWHAARVGASLLTHLGLREFVAQEPKLFVDLACALARDPGGLAALRRGLRDLAKASPLCDEVRFTRGFEAALVGVAREKGL